MRAGSRGRGRLRGTASARQVVRLHGAARFRLAAVGDVVGGVRGRVLDPEGHLPPVLHHPTGPGDRRVVWRADSRPRPCPPGRPALGASGGRGRGRGECGLGRGAGAPCARLARLAGVARAAGRLCRGRPVGAVATPWPTAYGRRLRRGAVGSAGAGSVGGDRTRLGRYGWLQPDGRSDDTRVRRWRWQALAGCEQRRPSLGHSVRDAVEHAGLPRRGRLFGTDG